MGKVAEQTTPNRKKTKQKSKLLISLVTKKTESILTENVERLNADVLTHYGDIKGLREPITERVTGQATWQQASGVIKMSTSVPGILPL